MGWVCRLKSGIKPLPLFGSSALSGTAIFGAGKDRRNTHFPHAPEMAPSPQPFPLSIQQKLVSFTNPTGTVTNSDVELAGVIAQHFDIRESTTATLSDNTPAVIWSRKGSTTSLKAPAYLLRMASRHQRFHRYCPEFSHIPGVANKMADDYSRYGICRTHNCLLILSFTTPSLYLGACVT
jgi:hypothetical protein